MAKDKLTEYDATAANNTVVGDVNLAENSALPSDMNNAVREVMSHQKEAFGSGTPLYVDQTNNRVGIGTTSTSAAQVTIQGSGNPRQLVITDDGAEKLQIFQIGNDATIEAGSGGSESTNLIFKTSSSGTEAERLRIQSGGGISFNGDTATANALDDYEEGTYTPQISATDGIGTLAYSTQVGTYTKIGNTVTFQLFIQVSSKGTVAGTIRLTLPFTAANVTNAFQSAAVRNDNVTGGSFSGNEQGGRIHANENIIRLDVMGSGTRSNFTAGNLLNNTNFIVSGSYRVN